MNYEHIPELLKESARFCLWRYQNRDGKYTKVPYSPRGGRARANDPLTFGSFNDAVSALSRYPNNYSGLGVGIFGDLVGIDIDHCIAEDGSLSELAQNIVGLLRSYTERSPSGRGIHIICRAPEFCETPDRYYTKNSVLGLEVYIAGRTSRYLTITGDFVSPYDEIRECPFELQALLDRYMQRNNGNGCIEEDDSMATESPKLSETDDAAVLARMLGSRNRDAISKLLNGEWEDTYSSQSEADLALCAHLAYWTEYNADQMDRLFRQSGLMRSKWDRPQSGGTYGKMTIERALAGGRGNQGHLAKAKPTIQETEMIIAFLRQVNFGENPRYTCDDVGAGYLLADYLRPIARPLLNGRGAWVMYDGKRWTDDREAITAKEAAKHIGPALYEYAMELPDKQKRDQTQQWAKLWIQESKRRTFLRDALSVHPISRGDFDKDPWLLNLENGTLDLRTHKLKKHDPEDTVTRICPVKYDPLATCPRWNQFVREVMVPGEAECADRALDVIAEEKADMLQRYLGYCLTGNTSAEKFMVLYGPTTRNGKSVCVESVRSVLGDYACSMNPESLVTSRLKDGRGPSEDIARLNGIRMASVPEIPKGRSLDASKVKQLTGGDTTNARFLGENSFDFRPQCKLLIHTNHLPQCADMSVFDSGRVLVIPFSKHFEDGEQDPGLKEFFRRPENQSAILNWMLDGLASYTQRGLIPPQSVREATASYAHDGDKVGRFIEDCLVEDPDGELKSATVYAAYQLWCDDNGHEAGSKPNLKRDLERQGCIKRGRPKAGGNMTTMVVGYRLEEEMTRRVSCVP